MNASFTSAAEMFPGWKADVLTGKPPIRYALGDGFERVKLGPGRVIIVGGPPGTGKTALALQWTTDAVRQSPDMAALIVNVEMPASALLERILARLSGVPLDIIEERKADDATHGERLAVGFATMEAFVPRLHFLKPPFDWQNIVATMKATNPRFLVLDYLQRIGAPQKTDSERATVSASMDCARRAADEGVAVLAMSAVSRPGQGRYDGLGLGSFRESSEIEYGCDDAFMLGSDDKNDETSLVLNHLKTRFGKRQDIPLRFRGDVMTFSVRDAAPEDTPPSVADEPLRQDIRAAWNSTAHATNGEPHGDK
jgi:replicative DNA helicase